MRDRKFVLNKICLALEHFTYWGQGNAFLSKVLECSCHIESLVHKTLMSGLKESILFLNFR